MKTLLTRIRINFPLRAYSAKLRVTVFNSCSVFQRDIDSSDTCFVICRPFSSSLRHEQRLDEYMKPVLYDRQLDFFGEPVTFLSPNHNTMDSTTQSSSFMNPTKITKVMTHLDAYILTVVSRGKAASGGGDDQGVSAKAAHSTAIQISNLIHSAYDLFSYNYYNIRKEYVECISGPERKEHELLTRTGPSSSSSLQCYAPMVIASLLSPILALTGSAYVHHLDYEYIDPIYKMNQASSTTTTKTTAKYIRLVEMGHSAIRILENIHSHHVSDIASSILNPSMNVNIPSHPHPNVMSPRELLHLHVLKHLLQDDFPSALFVLGKILELCPGDALALSLALDVSKMMGDSQASLRVATSVASYWSERGQRSITGQSILAGHSIGSSLIAVGLAMGGRYKDAEQLAEMAMKTDLDGSSGVCAWALAHAYDAEGRVSEGNSLLSGFDGVGNYEDCGYLFFDSRLGGYGARFALDRDGAHADRTAWRMYDSNFDRVLHYSGYIAQRDIHAGPLLRPRPESRRQRMMDTAEGAAKSFWGTLLSMSKDRNDAGPTSLPSKTSHQLEVITLEDIFAWLPPTTSLLTDATLLLFRLTICGTIKHDDVHWQDLRVAWMKAKAIQRRYSSCESLVFRFSPLTRIVSSLLLDDVHIEGSYDSISSKMEHAANLMGCLLKLKSTSGMNSDLLNENELSTKLCKLLSEVHSGCNWENTRPLAKDLSYNQFDVRTLYEYMVFYAATKSKRYDDLCMARSICSEGVFLRPNSPDNWWRYSIILDELGDTVAAEDARSASVLLGSGEGGRVRGQ